MSLKLLIIEGPDRCGKNTLIKNLCSQSENHIVRHWGSAKGENDRQKRNYQYRFFKKEFQLASERNKFEMTDEKRYPRDLYIWNRGHLGEFVYGNLYRDTKPQEWVMRMETDFSFDIDPSVYLLLLTAPADFLCKREDGHSFSSKVADKELELKCFDVAFNNSKIMNKKSISVANGYDTYLSQEIILDEVNKWLWA